MKDSNKQDHGFSLIEMMIVVAIIGIVTSIAYPSYQGYLKSSNRSVAQADLMSLAAALERHKAATYSYKAAAEGASNTGKPMVFHAHSPSSEPVAKKKYDLTIDTVSASGNSYILIAKPVSTSGQSGDGNLHFFSDGRKAWDINNNGAVAASEYCWSC